MKNLEIFLLGQDHEKEEQILKSKFLLTEGLNQLNSF
jgi:hypothetical protein